eukprot:COSAG05_NODE_1421_length_4927_cov_3.941384_3_plen_91_part_00
MGTDSGGRRALLGRLAVEGASVQRGFAVSREGRVRSGIQIRPETAKPDDRGSAPVRTTKPLCGTGSPRLTDTHTVGCRAEKGGKARGRQQ